MPEYWIVNLIERVLEVHRAPIPDPAVPFRSRFGVVQNAEPGAVVSPLARPEGHVRVADLFGSAAYAP